MNEEKIEFIEETINWFKNKGCGIHETSIVDRHDLSYSEYSIVYKKRQWYMSITRGLIEHSTLQTFKSSLINQRNRIMSFLKGEE